MPQDAPCTTTNSDVAAESELDVAAKFELLQPVPLKLYSQIYVLLLQLQITYAA